MKARLATAMLVVPLAASCSFEVERPNPTAGTVAGSYQLVIDRDAAGEPMMFLLDTRDGTLHERDGSGWRRIASGLDE